jgi:predicted aldo/keto reductase-like oxidoreductase
MDYLGKNIKKLGFGLMRLPMLSKEVDIEQTKVMADKFLEAGFTYFDTAYGYIGGKSEAAFKTAVADRYPRESFQLATKLPAWLGAKNAEEARQMFFTSLERTGAGYFDFYLLHNCGGERTKVFEEYDLWNFVLEQRAKGLIRHIGFSFHDNAEVLDELLTRHPEAEFVQLQINYADWESPTVQSRLCYETAKKHGKPVIIMEPVKGGLLATPPEPVKKVLREADADVSFASWAVRYAASLDNVITVLSGMSDIQQMEDNLATMKNFRPLDEKEQKTVEMARKALENMPGIPCTSCEYCKKGCPQSIAIPDVLGAMNRVLVYDNLKVGKNEYLWATKNNAKASECIACGNCESVCPQHISIIEELKRAAGTLE